VTISSLDSDLEFFSLQIDFLLTMIVDVITGVITHQEEKEDAMQREDGRSKE
jgi:hypothetical protein